MSDGILFPVPTIATTLPQVVTVSLVRAKEGVTLYQIPEDEWRQEEFLPVAWEPTVAKELSLIRAIPREAGDAVSYPRMHLRTLSGLWGVRLDQIQQSLQLPEKSWRRLAFEERPGVVANSFAVPFGHTLLYGQQKNGVTETLCIRRNYFPSVNPVDTDLLSRLAGVTNCCLVNWCRALVLLPSSDDFKEHFKL